MARFIEKASFAGLFIVLLSTSFSAPAKDKEEKPFLAQPFSSKQSIRFYKANKQLQADRVQLTGGDTDKIGCHNLLRKTRIFKALQIGFASCSLYQEKNCNVASLVPVQSEKQLYSSYLLTEGVAWLPQGEDERGVKVASWNCGAEVEPGEMRAEHLLAKKEKTRLTKAQQKAKKELDEAQAAFVKSQKTSEKAKEYATRVKQEALAMGVIEPEKKEGEEDKQAGETQPSEED